MIDDIRMYIANEKAVATYVLLVHAYKAAVLTNNVAHAVQSIILDRSGFYHWQTFQNVCFTFLHVSLCLHRVSQHTSV